LIIHGIQATGSLLPIHPRLRKSGMIRVNGRLIGGLGAGLEVIAYSLEKLSDSEKASLRAQLLKGRS
jgi:hypothetical protein